jgi:DNA polymerase/3'-5' exonuclease PolX
MWGNSNKYATHVRSGIPIDFFRTCETSWFNYLVCRTGPGASNSNIATRAREKGWKWHPYGSGFSRGREMRVMASEREVFEFVGLPYLEPRQRR